MAEILARSGGNIPYTWQIDISEALHLGLDVHGWNWRRKNLDFLGNFAGVYAKGTASHEYDYGHCMWVGVCVGDGVTCDPSTPT